MTIFKIKEAFSAEGWTEWCKNLEGLCVFPSGPEKHHSHSCLVSTWNLAGCDCAETGNTFQAYHGVRGLEEPIGGQLTAQSLLPATTENKKSPLRKNFSETLNGWFKEKGGVGRWMPCTNWPQVAFRLFRCSPRRSNVSPLIGHVPPSIQNIFF